MFMGEITDMEVLSNVPSVTYDYYQNNIKPENVGKTEDGQTIWRCRICGYEYVGEELPDDFICHKHGDVCAARIRTRSTVPVLSC